MVFYTRAEANKPNFTLMWSFADYRWWNCTTGAGVPGLQSTLPGWATSIWKAHRYLQVLVAEELDEVGLHQYSKICYAVQVCTADHVPPSWQCKWWKGILLCQEELHRLQSQSVQQYPFQHLDVQSQPVQQHIMPWMAATKGSAEVSQDGKIQCCLQQPRSDCHQQSELDSNVTWKNHGFFRNKSWQFVA